jgi:hypothetical protein
VTEIDGDNEREEDPRYIEDIKLNVLQDRRFIGKARLFRINADLALGDGIDLHSLCDYSQNTLDCGYGVYDFNEEVFSPKVEELFELIPFSLNILLIDRMEIDPPYRGRMIGLITLIKLIRRYQKGCSLAVIKPFPLQYAGVVKGQEEAFERDREKLVRYYARLGFERIPGTDFYAISLAYRFPTIRHHHGFQQVV